jgi:hypothetical protein
MRYLALLGLVAVLFGCQSKDVSNSTVGANQETPEAFVVWVSEYPSWSLFAAAETQGLFDGKQGALGTLEQKWNVDIVLKIASYDSCITAYNTGTNASDAACLTNLDALGPAQGRPGLFILPTSTSTGADACLTVGVESIDDLKNLPTKGLERSVSQYVFERSLELAGKNPKEFVFENEDPEVAARSMQLAQSDKQSIMVWQPFVLQTLRTRPEVKNLFNSFPIPNEIVDGVVVGADSLKRPGGENFACALIDIYYQYNTLLDNHETRDNAYAAIGAKFGSLSSADMQEVIETKPNAGGCRFFGTPEKGVEILNDSKFQTETLPRLLKFAASHRMAQESPNAFGFNNESAALNFTDKYIQKTQQGPQK